ncbi:ATP-binding protein [Actinomadura fibrosa]|uniref:ATP-binding protein n=1 Tax=Actinomadura fibrosa TaxID=111802 RepID=A0ABW2XS77_9ACTN|nr:ATP-binding protein [Actinomadura fibrosa]
MTAAVLETRGTLAIAPSARAPRLARAFLTEVFRERDLGDDYVGRLVITELVTNVHKHVGGDMLVAHVLCDDGAPVIQVWDERGDRLPAIPPDDLAAECGRGLLLMSVLVSAWGTRPLLEGGKIVWARLPR